jgi:hypothetical protein
LADFRLVSDLREFSVMLDQANQPAFVEVRIAAYVVDVRTGKSLAYLDNPVRAKVNNGSLGEVIAAYNQATSQRVTELPCGLLKLLRKISKD